MSTSRRSIKPSPDLKKLLPLKSSLRLDDIKFWLNSSTSSNKKVLLFDFAYLMLKTCVQDFFMNTMTLLSLATLALTRPTPPWQGITSGLR